MASHGLTVDMLMDPAFLNEDGTLNVNKILKQIKVDLPEETVIAIEKASRHRGREGHFGADYSQVVKEEMDAE